MIGKKIERLRELLRQGKRLVLYGTGTGGQYLYGLLSKKEGLQVACFCDGAEEKQAEFFEGKKVISPQQLLSEYAADIVVLTPMHEVYQEEMKGFLQDNHFQGAVYTLQDFLEKDVATNRDFCAYMHKGMQKYFESAERESSLDVFWKAESPFLALFERLDLTNVVELACGRGRHVPKYQKRSGHITLVDILDENMEYCRQRFQQEQGKFSFYKNNGYDLQALADETYTSLFTYDAMVHFEALDVYSYIKETYRILQRGGYALFHHSNNDADYWASFSTAPHGRAFMSMQLFAYFAYKAGFEIVTQRSLDWGIKDLDGLTLLRKADV